MTGNDKLDEKLFEEGLTKTQVYSNTRYAIVKVLGKEAGLLNEIFEKKEEELNSKEKLIDSKNISLKNRELELVRKETSLSNQERAFGIKEHELAQKAIALNDLRDERAKEALRLTRTLMKEYDDFAHVSWIVSAYLSGKAEHING